MRSRMTSWYSERVPWAKDLAWNPERHKFPRQFSITDARPRKACDGMTQGGPVLKSHAMMQVQRAAFWYCLAWPHCKRSTGVPR